MDENKHEKTSVAEGCADLAGCLLVVIGLPGVIFSAPALLQTVFDSSAQENEWFLVVVVVLGVFFVVSLGFLLVGFWLLFADGNKRRKQNTRSEEL